MIDRRAGHVFATSSSGGLYPAWVPGYHSVYLAAKMGVIGLMLNLRNELAEFGVGASVLVAGGVWTAMKENNGRYRPERFGRAPEGLAEPPQLAKDAMFASGAESGQVAFRAAEDVAEMVLVALRDNRPVLVTSPTDRRMFQETYVDVMLSAFDDVEAFEAERKPASSG
jgi:short-subunit dehydrogenase